MPIDCAVVAPFADGGGHFVRAQVGVLEVLGRVVDGLELIVQIQHAGQRLLQHADRMIAAVVPQPFERLALWHHQLEEHLIVAAEPFVEPVIVVRVADVDRADQVDCDGLALGRNVVSGCRLQCERTILGIPPHAHERQRVGRGRFILGFARGLIGAGFRGRLGRPARLGFRSGGRSGRPVCQNRRRNHARRNCDRDPRHSTKVIDHGRPLSSGSTETLPFSGRIGRTSSHAFSLLCRKLPVITRSSGLLLHVSSLPSEWGIGDFGPPATAWIDRLAEAGQRRWQFLPLSPPGRGNSPYEPFSTFALNELFLSPDCLVEDGLLQKSELPAAQPSSRHVDYSAAITLKHGLLELAQTHFRGGGRPDMQTPFEQFCQAQASWLDDYALFRSLGIAYGDREFHAWPPALLHRDPAALAEARRNLSEVFDRFRLGQFLAHRQLLRLREHARSREVGLIGDVPFFVSPDSSDVCASRIVSAQCGSAASICCGSAPRLLQRGRPALGRPLVRLGRLAPHWL